MRLHLGPSTTWRPLTPTLIHLWHGTYLLQLCFKKVFILYERCPYFSSPGATELFNLLLVYASETRIYISATVPFILELFLPNMKLQLLQIQGWCLPKVTRLQLSSPVPILDVAATWILLIQNGKFIACQDLHRLYKSTYSTIIY